MEIYSGTLALLSTLLVAILGIGSQIWHTHQTKEVDSISPLLVILLTLNCGAFVFHSIIINDLTLFLCQIPWIVCGGIFLYQFIKYKSKQNNTKTQHIYIQNSEFKIYIPKFVHLKETHPNKGGENA